MSSCEYEYESKDEKATEEVSDIVMKVPCMKLLLLLLLYPTNQPPPYAALSSPPRWTCLREVLRCIGLIYTRTAAREITPLYQPGRRSLCFR